MKLDPHGVCDAEITRLRSALAEAMEALKLAEGTIADIDRMDPRVRWKDVLKPIRAILAKHKDSTHD